MSRTVETTRASTCCRVSPPGIAAQSGCAYQRSISAGQRPYASDMAVTDEDQLGHALPIEHTRHRGGSPLFPMRYIILRGISARVGWSWHCRDHLSEVLHGNDAGRTGSAPERPAGVGRA